MSKETINGYEMYYEVAGDGFPLAFIHGGFGGLGTGTRQEAPSWIEKFAKHFQVITYDRRSSGRSSYPEEGHTMKNFAKDLRELLRHLGHERAHVWGTSAGGQITLMFGLEYPEAAASLVVADGAPWLSLDPDVIEKLKKRLQILKEQGGEAAYDARRTDGTVGLNLFQGRPAQSEDQAKARDEQRARIQQALAQFTREDRVHYYKGELLNYSAYLEDLTDRLHEMKPPVLVLHGDQDSVYPVKAAEDMGKMIPNVEYKIYQGAEHGVTGLFPESLDLIVDFLKKNTPLA